MKLKSTLAMASVVAMATLSMNGGVVKLKCSPEMVKNDQVRANLYYAPDTVRTERFSYGYNPTDSVLTFVVDNDRDYVLQVVENDVAEQEPTAKVDGQSSKVRGYKLDDRQLDEIKLQKSVWVPIRVGADESEVTLEAATLN